MRLEEAIRESICGAAYRFYFNNCKETNYHQRLIIWTDDGKCYLAHLDNCNYIRDLYPHEYAKTIGCTDWNPVGD